MAVAVETALQPLCRSSYIGCASNRTIASRSCRHAQGTLNIYLDVFIVRWEPENTLGDSRSILKFSEWIYNFSARFPEEKHVKACEYMWRSSLRTPSHTLGNYWRAYYNLLWRLYHVFGCVQTELQALKGLGNNRRAYLAGMSDVFNSLTAHCNRHWP